MARPQKGDFDWKDIINNLKGPFPEVGSDPPVLETEEKTKTVRKWNGINPDSLGNFSRVSMDIYYFLDGATGKYYMMQNQKLSDLGEMTLAEAAEIVSKAKRRR